MANTLIQNTPVVAPGDPAHNLPVAVSPAVAPGGIASQLAVDGGGNLLIAGSLSVTPATSAAATASSQTTLGTTAATAIAANAARKGFSIQNQGTTVLKILLGNGTPTQANYTVALPACGVANDGSSRPYTGLPGVVWTGAVQWISSAAGGLGEAVELT